MKLLLACIMFFPGLAFSQLIKGRIVDSDSKGPIEYVNIGVVGKNKGTLSDINGIFSLELLSVYDKDTFRISAIGYNSVSFPVEDIKRIFIQNSNDLIIEMTRKIPVLPEVIVGPHEFYKNTIGSRGGMKALSIAYESGNSGLGTETGTILKIKKAPAYIQDVNFIVKSNTYDDSIHFRINLYNVNNDLPGENILKEPIYVATKIKKGILSVNLESYNIYVENDFLLSLEWLQEMGEKEISFSIRLRDRKSFHRTTSQANWDRVPVCSLNFYATVLYIK